LNELFKWTKEANTKIARKDQRPQQQSPAKNVAADVARIPRLLWASDGTQAPRPKTKKIFSQSGNRSLFTVRAPLSIGVGVARTAEPLDTPQMTLRSDRQQRITP